VAARVGVDVDDQVAVADGVPVRIGVRCPRQRPGRGGDAVRVDVVVSDALALAVALRWPLSSVSQSRLGVGRRCRPT